MGKAIVITSGKGGVGKTTTTANLGTALALLGKRVCLVDLDIGLRNLDVILGLDNRIIYNIVDVAQGTAKLHQALIKDKRFDDKLYLLPAAQNTDKSALEPEEVKAIVEELIDLGINTTYLGQEIIENEEFNGKSFVLTGSLTIFTREEAKEKIESLGGKTVDSVSKKTSVVIVGEKPGSKYEKALKLGIPIWTEEEFKEKLQ